MDRTEFQLYKSRFIEGAQRVLERERTAALAEAAFPAYTNPNPLINHLFWSRIQIVMRYIEEHRPAEGYRAALDFGCGGGAMLPFLSRQADHVLALDTDLGPAHKMASWITFPPNIEFLDARQTALSDLSSRSLDAIVALDVLEHVDDLTGVVAEFHRLLAPGGFLIVSGPTENPAYRLGRRLAGQEYTGDYHVRDIYRIRQAIGAIMPVRRLARLYPFLPLFELFTAAG